MQDPGDTLHTGSVGGSLGSCNLVRKDRPETGDRAGPSAARDSGNCAGERPRRPHSLTRPFPNATTDFPR